MKSEKTQRALRRRSTQVGFTLVELMIVVTIVGVLSAIAIPSFQNYIGKSRTAEAIDYLGAIKLREESYRSEFGQYCATTDGLELAGIADLEDSSNLVPNPAQTANQRTALLAESSTSTTAKNAFLQMGMRFTEPLRFGYGVAAGSPGSIPFDYGWTTANADFWFIARAVADLDFDGDFITFESYSASRKLWIGADGNPPPAWTSKGWD